jgi:hypothetical protein
MSGSFGQDAGIQIHMDMPIYIAAETGNLPLAQALLDVGIRAHGEVEDDPPLHLALSPLNRAVKTLSMRMPFTARAVSRVQIKQEWSRTFSLVLDQG